MTIPRSACQHSSPPFLEGDVVSTSPELAADDRQHQRQQAHDGDDAEEQHPEQQRHPLVELPDSLRFRIVREIPQHQVQRDHP